MCPGTKLPAARSQNKKKVPSIPGHLILMTIKPFEPVPLSGLDVNTPASNTVHEISPCSRPVKVTEQHVLLSSTFCAYLGKLYTSPRICAPCFQSLGELST